eukprot:jgi/Mesvir1/7153/Mv02513-RA.1
MLQKHCHNLIILHGAPMRLLQVVVEYCEQNKGYVDRYIAVAEAIEADFPNAVVEGNPDGVTPRVDAFEVTAGGHLLFSKLKEKRLPEPAEVLARYKNILG